MPAKREVYAPDGRAWTVARRVEGGGLLARLLPSGWLIEATTEGPPAESRQWRATSRQQANEVLDDVAMALRTGAEGPTEPDDGPTSAPGG